MIEKSSANRDMKGERGMVLFIVLLLIVLFTGLGILALRHTRQELRSSGAYFDNQQAAALAEGALAMAATDFKLSSDYYRKSFSNAEYELLTDDAGPGDLNEQEYSVPLNPSLFVPVSGGYCDSNPTVSGCVHQLSYPISWDPSQDDVFNVWARTTLRQSSPMIGPCPPGFSCSDEQNYAWYIFKVDASSVYGTGLPGSGGGVASAPSTGNLFSHGRADARAIMTVGPVGVFGR